MTINKELPLQLGARLKALNTSLAEYSRLSGGKQFADISDLISWLEEANSPRPLEAVPDETLGEVAVWIREDKRFLVHLEGFWQMYWALETSRLDILGQLHQESFGYLTTIANRISRDTAWVKGVNCIESNAKTPCLRSGLWVDLEVLCDLKELESSERSFCVVMNNRAVSALDMQRKQRNHIKINAESVFLNQEWKTTKDMRKLWDELGRDTDPREWGQPTPQELRIEQAKKLQNPGLYTQEP